MVSMLPVYLYRNIEVFSPKKFVVFLFGLASLSDSEKARSGSGLNSLGSVNLL
jgi:hypothetical protein